MNLFSRTHVPRMSAHSAERAVHHIEVDGGYAPDTLVVAAGVPVRVIFHRHDGFPCSREVVFPDHGVRATLVQHEDVVVDLPQRGPGVYAFECGEGMLHGRLVVR